MTLTTIPFKPIICICRKVEDYGFYIAIGCIMLSFIMLTLTKLTILPDIKALYIIPLYVTLISSGILIGVVTVDYHIRKQIREITNG